MKQRICIAGSGKMAVNIGLYFLQKEHPVYWVSHSSEQLSALNKIIRKTRKRIERFLPEKSGTFEAGTFTYGSGIPEPDIIIESSKESLQVKQSIFSSLEHVIGDQTLLFSNSSSILPEKIHSRCLGAHFFFPVELTGIVELITPTTGGHHGYDRSLSFFTCSGLDLIKQDSRSAFIANRLLLPLQAAALQASRDGFHAEDIDAISKSDLISFGQLSLMDSIGLDIVRSSAVNYRGLEPTILTPDFDLLISSLDLLIKSGKLGGKNGSGLLMGAPVPWHSTRKSNKMLHSLGKQFKQLIQNGCADVLRKKMITEEELSMILNRIFHAVSIPDDLLEN